MSQQFAVFILMSNYFHDVATAMIVACSFALWVILEKFGQEHDDQKQEFLRRLYQGLRRLVIFSWAWVISAGVLRIATFNSFELVNAVEKHHEAALMVKYAIAGTMMICGAISWTVLDKKAGVLLGTQKKL